VVVVGVVVGRVGIAIDVGRGDEGHELMAELVGHWVADERHLRVWLQHAEDVVRDGVGELLLLVAALLDVGVLVDDPGLKRREVGGDVAREVLRELLLELVLGSATRGQRVAGWRRAGRDDPLDRGEVDPELGQVRRDVEGLEVEARGLPGAIAGQRDLDLVPVALGEVRDRGRAVLDGRRRDDEDLVVVRRRVVRRVVDVEVVEAVEVERGREGRVRDLELLLHRRRVRGRDVRPAGGGVEIDPLVRHPERVRERRLAGQVVVQEDAAVREEVDEVDGRAIDARVGTTDPVDLGDLLAGPFSGGGEGVGLEGAGPGEARPVVEVPFAGAVVGVVGRTVLARPGPGHHRVPADAGVRREGRLHAVEAADAGIHEGLVGRHVAGCGVPLHQVGPHPVRGKEQGAVRQRVRVAPAGRSGRDGGRQGRRQQGHRGKDHEGARARANGQLPESVGPNHTNTSTTTAGHGARSASGVRPGKRGVTAW
jgi:hypothetical protein